MSAAAITKPQIGAIHTLAARAGIKDDDYRDYLEKHTGRRSSKDLSKRQAIQVIDGLKAIAGPPSKPRRKALQGPYATKFQALWISAWQLGIIRNKTDEALLAFVKRQTDVDHVTWLREPAEAMKAIEGLKAWMSREAGVVWSVPGRPELANPKLRVVLAQLKILGDAAPPELLVTLDEWHLNDHHLVSVMQQLGALIRASEQNNNIKPREASQ